MEDLLEKFYLSKEQLHLIAKLFCQQINAAHSEDTHEKADIKCFITMLRRLPTGLEVGKALNLQLEREYIRVHLATYQGVGEVTKISHCCKIPEAFIHGFGVKLFDYIVHCLYSFLKEHKLNDSPLPLGLTMQFPVEFKSYITRKISGGDSSNLIDHVNKLLREAIERHKDLKVYVVDVINATVEVFMSVAHRHPNCCIGLMIDSACEVCYLEQCSRIELIDANLKGKHDRVIVSVEWGSFGTNGDLDTILTEYDREIDSNSLSEGKEIFYKLIAGMYLGEICRLIILKAVKMNLITIDDSIKSDVIIKLETKNLFSIQHIIDIEGDGAPEFKNTRMLIEKLFNIVKANDDFVRCLRLTCEAVSIRSATLVALAITVLINRINKPNCIVGVDGSVYRTHPNYNKYLRETLRKQLNHRHTFQLITAENAHGAALSALPDIGDDNEELSV